MAFSASSFDSATTALDQLFEFSAKFLLESVSRSSSSGLLTGLSDLIFAPLPCEWAFPNGAVLLELISFRADATRDRNNLIATTPEPWRGAPCSGVSGESPLKAPLASGERLAGKLPAETFSCATTLRADP